MRSSTLNKTREYTSRRWFLGALFVEDRKIRLKNWSSQRSFIHSSSLVAVYAVNTSFQNKPIDPRVPRQCHCTFGIPANDLHIFSFSLPFSRVFACDTRIMRYICSFMQTLWTCIAHDRNACLFSVELCEKRNRITTTRNFPSLSNLNIRIYFRNLNFLFTPYWKYYHHKNISLRLSDRFYTFLSIWRKRKKNSNLKECSDGGIPLVKDPSLCPDSNVPDVNSR